MPIGRRRALALLSAPVMLGGLRALPHGIAAAQERYPVRPIRLIVPFPAGGPFDGVPRIVGQQMTERLGQRIVVENRSGASGQLGIVAAKLALPDGYTLVVINSVTHGSVPAVKRNPGYDPIHDFIPVILLAAAPQTLLVHKDVPARTVAELIELLRAKPGQLSYASGSYGSQNHLTAVMFLARAGLAQSSATPVPYQGLAPAMTDLLAGVVQFMFSTTGNATDYIEGGRLRALATASLARWPRLPDVPTMIELGYPGFAVTSWCGLGAPAATSATIIGILNESANAALAVAAVRSHIAAFDYAPRGGTPAEFAQFIADELTLWKKLAQDHGLTQD